MVGERLGHYRIEEQIGAGGMGVVYRALDEKLRRPVAVKLLARSTVSQAERRARIFAEARAAAALNHPGIITVYEVGEHGDQIFLVMELMEGRTLRDGLAPHAPADLCRIGLQLAEALAAAHDAGVLHGDIKPENIFLLRDGRVKLLDFGIARQFQAQAIDTLTSGSGELDRGLTGTLLYMAPEQLRGEASSARSDLFSLGVVLYELATGTHPFAGKTVTEITANIIHQRPEPLQDRLPAAHAPLARLIARLLEKDPALRLASARELAAEIVRAADTASLQNQLPASVAAKTAVAVVPFSLLTPSPEFDYLGVALADAVVNELSATGKLLVRPAAAAARLAGQHAEPAVVARELDVGVVVTGSIQKFGERLRVHVQAWNAADGSILHSAKQDAGVHDLFSLQDELAAGLVAALAGLRRDSNAQPEPPTQNPYAYELFLRAAERLARANRWDARTAIEMLEKAVELDPRFADAWARLAEACVLMAVMFDPDPKLFAVADRAIRRALAVDPHNAEAHCARGRVLWTPLHGFKNRPALRTLNLALRLNPGCQPARIWRCLILLHIGLLAEAREGLLEALAANPDDAFTTVFLGQTAMYAWRYDEAREYQERTLRIDPTHLWGRIFYPTLALYAGQLEEAEKRIAVARQVLPTDAWVTTCEALLWAKRGEKRKADAALKKSLGVGGKTLLHTHHMWHTAACAYALIGKPAEALHWLKKAATTGLPNHGVFRDDPHLVSLRDDARYQKLLASLKREFSSYQREFGGPALPPTRTPSSR